MKTANSCFVGLKDVQLEIWGKFREGTPTTPKVIGAHVWNFKASPTLATI